MTAGERIMHFVPTNQPGLDAFIAHGAISSIQCTTEISPSLPCHQVPISHGPWNISIILTLEQKDGIKMMKEKGLS